LLVVITVLSSNWAAAASVSLNACNSVLHFQTYLLLSSFLSSVKANGYCC